MAPRSPSSGFNPARITALVVIGFVALGLVFMGLPSGPGVDLPKGARAGDLKLESCTYDTEEGSLDADCGTLVVPENRNDPRSDLIALPVTRIRAAGRAAGETPAEPIFRLQGGPGSSNMSFPMASRLTERHDVVLVGYRGVEGSRVLQCPEVESALRNSGGLGSEESMRRYGDAFAGCARRLTAEGVDLDGYSLPQRVDDLEAVRKALRYDRINLISTSAGTRTAMVYSWRYPRSILRSVMIAVNPPGRFLWDPAITDEQLGYYSKLCARDATCAARTDDLAASMKATSANLPDRWAFLPIEESTVRVATMFGLFHATEAAAPLNAPTMFDAWLAAAEGDPSGLYALSVMAKLILPGANVWGEFAAFGSIDAEAIDAFYSAGGDRGSILRNAASDFLWGGGRVTNAWPASPDHAGYREVRRTEVETLLIGGTVDFSTPARNATEELLPALPNGRQVILPELGHSTDFWSHRPEAGERLLTTFFDTGKVDDSLYDTRPVAFELGTVSMSTIAKVLVGVLAGLALIAVALLGGMAYRVRRRGGFGPRMSVLLRVLAPVVVGLGGWCLAVLVVSTVWPSVFVGGGLVVVPSIGIAAGLGIFLAWVRRDRASGIGGLAAALSGSLLGGWLGFQAADGLTAPLTALIGATITANLALLVLDILRDRNVSAPTPQAVGVAVLETR